MSITWLEIIQTIAPTATAVIAYSALKSWKNQDRAKREAEFLSDLVDATHEVVGGMLPPLTIVRMAKIGIESHVPTWKDGDQTINGVIAYIENAGTDTSARLRKALEPVWAPTARLRALAAKGQIFSFPEYKKCHNAVDTLTSQVDKINAFAFILGQKNLNWENDLITKNLEAAWAIDSDNISSIIEDSNIFIIEYTQKAYAKIYGQREYQQKS